MANQSPDIDFQHLLAHTFPGFFSAITLFMLLDFWSPKNLTAVVLTPEGLIGFAGFVLIIGTILGIILDGIHHMILEDGIFNYLEEIEAMRKSICKFFPEKIEPWTKGTSILESLLTPHDFVLFFCTKKWLKESNVFEMDKELISRYYRYSEFFSNTFISLTIFSVAAPLYLSKEMNISWDLSVLLGLICLSIAILCFEASHLAYVRYLKSQITYICGINGMEPDDPNILINKKNVWLQTNLHIKDVNKRTSGQNPKNKRKILLDWIPSLFNNINIYSIAITVMFALIVSLIFWSLRLNINFPTISICFAVALLLFTAIFRSQKKFFTNRFEGRIFQEMTFSYVGTILAVLIIMYFYPMECIQIMPSPMNCNITFYENDMKIDIILGNIAIVNMGSNLSNISYYASPEYFSAFWGGQGSTKNNTNRDLSKGETCFLFVNFSTNSLRDEGEYRGEIILTGIIENSSLFSIELVKQRNFTKSIPILVRTKASHFRDTLFFAGNFTVI